MMRPVYAIACVLTAIRQLAVAQGVEDPGAIPEHLTWVCYVSAGSWLLAGIYAFWWRPR